MSLIDVVRRHLPPKYRELAKFLVVGGTAWIVDTGLFTLLSHTVLSNKAVSAKAISILVATVLSYVLNREWSFSQRGGLERHHEATAFFVVNGLAMVLNLVPLAMTRWVFGITVPEYSQTTVSVVDFIAANIVGTLLGMGFRYWAYRRFVFPDELGPHPDQAAYDEHRRLRAEEAALDPAFDQASAFRRFDDEPAGEEFEEPLPGSTS